MAKTDTTRPYVVCHMCATIDGKVLTARWGDLPGPRDAGELFNATAERFGIGSWLVGTTTMKEFAGRQAKLPRVKAPVPPGDHVANPTAKTLAIGTDAHAVLRFQQSDVDGDHVVLLITDQAGDDYRAHLRRAGVSYLLCGRTEVDLPLALAKLRRSFNLRKLMLQGGGKLNGSMLQAGLVDEISQVVVPVVDGGGLTVTGLFDPPAAPPHRAAATLRLIAHTPLPGGVHWSRYRILPAPRRPR